MVFPEPRKPRLGFYHCPCGRILVKVFLDGSYYNTEISIIEKKDVGSGPGLFILNQDGYAS